MGHLRIAHLADLHLSPEYRRDNIHHAREALSRVLQSGVDHIVVTGDITANAERRDFHLARQLFASFGLLDSSRLTLAIGNHDIFGGVHTAEDILAFPKRCRETDYRERVQTFWQHFVETFEGVTYGGTSSIFPFAKVVGETVLFVVNSVARYAPLRNPFGSNGEVSSSEALRLERLLSSRRFAGLRRIVLLHHHLHTPVIPLSSGLPAVWGLLERQTMKLRGRRALLRLLERHGVELVLHGHHHKTESYTKGAIACLNAGGTILGPHEDIVSYNLLTVGDQGITVRPVTFPSPGPDLPDLPDLPVPAVPLVPTSAHQAA